MRITIVALERDPRWPYHEKEEMEQIVVFHEQDTREMREQKREQVRQALLKGERWVG